MADDPLKLSLLDQSAIDKAVASRQKGFESDEAKLRAHTNAQKEERLQAKGKAREAPPPPPPPTPELPKRDKSILLDKIGQYKERFPELKSRNKLSGKSSLEEVEDELHYLEQQLGTKDGNMAVHVLIASMAGVEYVTEHHFNPLGLQLKGLSQVTKDNQAEFKPVLDELMIKYGTSMYVSPEMRLCGLVATMMYTVHSANSGDIATLKAMNKMTAAAKGGPSDL